MKFPPYYRVYEAENDGNGNDGGGGGGGNSNPLDSEEVKTLIRQQVEEATSALKRKNDELIGEKRQLAESLNVFEGVDKEELKTFIDSMKNNEEAKLIAEGKVDEVINKRTERMREALQARIEDEAKRTQEWEKKYSTLETTFHGSLIDNTIRDAAAKSKVHPTAMEDIVARAHQAFTYENGKVVSKDSATGEIKIGSDGKSPYAPTDFMEDLKKTAPHFWPSSSSAGFTGNFADTPSGADELRKALHSEGGYAKYKEMRAKQKKG